MRPSVALLLFLAGPPSALPLHPTYFTPVHRLSGIGVDRYEMPDEVLAARTNQMIESQTFGIMRDAQSVAGAERITGAKLQPIFREASRRSGLPAPLIEAISYLESWGIPN